MMTNFRRLLSVILCVVLLAAVALTAIGCSDKEQNENDGGNSVVQQTTGDDENQETPDEAKVVGKGQKQFDFTVVDIEGNETKFIVKTDKKTVGEALLDVELISGEDGQYGLYVKTVNGITVDYDKDKTYWGFYINDEYAMTGVDQTEIEEGKTYTFKVSK